MCKEVKSFFQHQSYIVANTSILHVLRSDHPSFHETCVLKKLCSQANGNAALKVSPPELEGHGHDEENQLIEQSLDLFVE